MAKLITLEHFKLLSDKIQKLFNDVSRRQKSIMCYSTMMPLFSEHCKVSYDDYTFTLDFSWTKGLYDDLQPVYSVIHMPTRTGSIGFSLQELYDKLHNDTEQFFFGGLDDKYTFSFSYGTPKSAGIEGRALIWKVDDECFNVVTNDELEKLDNVICLYSIAITSGIAAEVDWLPEDSTIGGIWGLAYALPAMTKESAFVIPADTYGYAYGERELNSDSGPIHIHFSYDTNPDIFSKLKKLSDKNIINAKFAPKLFPNGEFKHNSCYSFHTVRDSSPIFAEILSVEAIDFSSSDSSVTIHLLIYGYDLPNSFGNSEDVVLDRDIVITYK